MSIKNPLDLKNIIVVGGSRGIGKNIIETIHLSCERLIFTFKQAEHESNDLISKLNNSKISALELDLTCHNSIKGFTESLKSLSLKIDGLVINAGINHPNDFNKINKDEWSSVVNTNLSGPFFLMQSLDSFLNNHASIVLMGSVSGQYGGPRTSHYAVSKAGLIALGQNAARYFASRSIRVNTIAAGLIESEMATMGASHPSVQKNISSILLGRFGKKSEVANTTHFLLSEMSSYITAQTINVNGGLYF